MKKLIAAVLVTASFSSGCYTYAPAEWHRIEPGSEVRAHLTIGAAPETDYGAFLEQDLAVAVMGKLVSAGDGRLVLDLPSGTLDDGMHRKTLYRRVILNPEEFGAIEVRKLDRWRTGGVIGGIGTALLMLLVKSLNVKDPGGAPPTQPGGEL